MNSQGSLSVLVCFYHLALKTRNIKNLSVVYVFSHCMEQYTFFITKMRIKFKLSRDSQ